MHRMKTLVLLFLFSLLSVAPTRAAEIVRGVGLIETMPIRGVTLAMTPREAFDHLTALGYSANGVPTFDDWNTGGLSMVRGDHMTAEGRSEIALARTQAGERLVNISETFNRPKTRIDSHAEIQKVRDHFGIAADDPKCRVNDHGSGTCRVADAAENANHVFGISAFPAMILRYATRNKELKDSY